MPKCTNKKLDFGRLGRRVIEADFSGGDLSSEAGVLLLRRMDQRVGLCQGWADVSDPNALRADLAMQTAATPEQAWALHRVLLDQFNYCYLALYVFCGQDLLGVRVAAQRP